MNLKQKLISILFIITILFILLNRTKVVECQIEKTTCPDDLIENLNTLKGSSFFFTNISQKLEDNKTNDSIYILESISKKFPGTIKLSFKQEEIKYSLLINDQIFYIGKSGATIPTKLDNTQTVSFTWKNEKDIVKDNNVEDSYHKKFLNIAESLSKNTKENIIIIWVSDSEIILEIPDEPIYIFDKQTIETQVKKVDTIINAKELEEIEEPILEIDMRFDLPVLRTRQ